MQQQQLQQQQMQQQQQLQQMQQMQQVQSPGYIDKLFNKKREFFKLIQLSLILVLGLSIHYFIKFFIKHYIAENDLSFGRTLLIKGLYIISTMFVLWNIRVFSSWK